MSNSGCILTATIILLTVIYPSDEQFLRGKVLYLEEVTKIYPTQAIAQYGWRPSVSST